MLENFGTALVLFLMKIVFQYWTIENSKYFE